MSIESCIILLAGPPFSLSLEAIGWLTREQIQKLYLSCREASGRIDWELLRIAEAQEQPEAAAVDPWEAHRALRRQQALPEYLIDREIRTAQARLQHGR